MADYAAYYVYIIIHNVCTRDYFVIRTYSHPVTTNSYTDERKSDLTVERLLKHALNFSSKHYWKCIRIRNRSWATVIKINVYCSTF